MEILAKLLGSAAKVKIMRLFLFSEQKPYDLSDIMVRAKVTKTEAKKEIAVLEKINLIKNKAFLKDTVTQTRNKTIAHKIKARGWVLNESFPYLTSVRNLLITVSLHSHEDLANRFNNVGKVKALIVAGVFTQDWESRIDLLIVGDHLKTAKIEQKIKDLESEVGRELRYSIFETGDFQYRMSIYDKLVRDILDFPHVKVVDRLDLR
jgi:hypothetical protein